MRRFPPKKSRELLEFTKTVILLGLAGYELIITNEASLVIYISSYPARPRRITVNYIFVKRPEYRAFCTLNFGSSPAYGQS